MTAVKDFVKRALYVALTAVLAAGSFNIPVKAAEDPVLYEEDFESKETGDGLAEWTPDRSGAFIGVAEENGNRVMRIGAADKINTTVYFTKEFEKQNSGKLEISFDFKAGQTSGSASYMTLSNENDNLVQFQVHNNGKLVWNKGGGKLVTLLNSYNADQWYHVRMDADLRNKEADIYIEDELVLEDEAFNNTNAAGADNIKTAVATGSSNCEFEYDNFKVVKKEEILPSAITISQESAKIQPCEKLQLNAQVTPEEADCKVVWTSDNEEAAVVSDSGLVTGVGEGSAIITASVEGSVDLSAECSVKVESRELPWLEDFQDEKYVVGESPADWIHTGSEQVSFTIADDEDNKMLLVDSNGKLPSSEVSPFVQTSIPIINEGRMLLSMKIYPFSTSGVGYIYVDDSTGNNVMQINIGSGGKIQINKTGTPQNLISYETGRWQTIGFVFDMDNKTVDLMYEGEIVVSGITSITKDDISKLRIGSGRGYTTKFMVDDITVDEGPALIPESLELTEHEVSMRIGETETFDYVVTPEQAYGAENIKYKSDNEDVVSVAQDGTVTAKKAGTANITVFCEDKPEIADTCTVEVKKYGIDKIFYVSPDGDDKDDGSKTAPFLTAVRAAEEVKKYNSDMQGDIIVFFREGVYTFDETLNLDQTISGSNGYSVILKAYQDESVTFSGGMQLTGWKELNDGSGIWYTTVDRDIETRQLYINGEIATRARSSSGLPNSTYDGCNSPDQAVGHTTTDTSMAEWKNQSDIEMVYKQNWTNPRCAVEKITLSDDGTKAVIQMQQPGYYFCRNKLSTSTTNPWFIENAYELLDTPGEWYLDETGEINSELGANTFYYMPKNGEDINSEEVIVPVLEELVNVKGTVDTPVQDVKFEGISFQHTTWLRPGTDRGLPDAQNNVIREYDPSLSISNHLFREYIGNGSVNLEYTDSLEFDSCDFRNIGGAAALAGRIGLNKTVIQNSTFTKLSGGAIQLGEVDMYTEDFYNPSDERLLIRNTLIDNNTITNVSNEYRSAAAVGAGYPSNITISHNTISDVPYSGMSIGWGWEKREVFATKDVKILGNHIYNCMMELNDGGAVYTLGYTSSSAYHMNVVQGNYIHDQYANFGLLYFDEGADYYCASGNVISTAAKPSVKWLLHKNSTNKVFDNYIDSEADSPDCTEENFYVSDSSWPAEAQEIMNAAGAQAVVETVNVDGLKELLITAGKIQNESDYEASSWAVFIQAKETAQGVIDLGVYTESDIQESWYCLADAMESLEPASGEEEKEPVSKTTLEYFLNKAKEHVAAGDVDSCVESVQKLFEEAIAEGDAVMADTNATKDEVMNASLKLMKAIHALNMKAADKTDLEMAVELAEMIDLADYVEAGQKEFTDALAAAEAVLADGDAMQGDVDTAWDALVTAMENLRLKADKSVLEGLLNEVEDLDLAPYTEASAAVFRSALASAQAVFADVSLSVDDQQTVDAAAAALKEARDGLAEKADDTGDGDDDGQKPDDGQDTDDSQNPDSGNQGGDAGNGSSMKQAAKTGDTAPILGLMLLLAASGAVTLTVYRKRGN